MGLQGDGNPFPSSLKPPVASKNSSAGLSSSTHHSVSAGEPGTTAPPPNHNEVDIQCATESPTLGDIREYLQTVDLSVRAPIAECDNKHPVHTLLCAKPAMSMDIREEVLRIWLPFAHELPQVLSIGEEMVTRQGEQRTLPCRLLS